MPPHCQGDSFHRLQGVDCEHLPLFISHSLFAHDLRACVKEGMALAGRGETDNKVSLGQLSQGMVVVGNFHVADENYHSSFH